MRRSALIKTKEEIRQCHKMLFTLSGLHSLVDPSVLTILRPRVRIPSIPSMLFQFVTDVKKTKNKQKEAGIGKILQNTCIISQMLCHVFLF